MKTYKISYPEDQGVKYESFRYPAGEIQIRIKPEELPKLQKTQRLVVMASSIDGEVMGLALLTDALFSQVPDTCRKVLVLPYLPYSRADRRFVKGDCLALSVFGRMINAMRYNLVETFDVHNPVAAEASIENVINLSPIDHYDHITPITIIVGREDLSLMLPDEGSARYDLTKYKLPILQASKTRNPETGQLSGFKVPYISTQKVLIVDDICDGGGTFIGLADEIQKLYKGHVKLYLYVSHGIFSKGIDQLLDRFEKIFYSGKDFKLKEESRYGSSLSEKACCS